MQFQCQKTENCFTHSQTYEYRLPLTVEAFANHLGSWEIFINRRYRRPMLTANRQGVNIKGILNRQIIKVSFPEAIWEEEKASFDQWLSAEGETDE
jgi:hypothetical protein